MLFDFDGVLLDTEPVHFACWREILSTFSVPFEWDVYVERYIGVSDRDMIREVCALREPPADVAAVMEHHPRKKDLFRDRMVATARLRDDVRALLDELRGACKMAVVTSSGRGEIEPILRAMGVLEHFDAVVYGGDVKRLKPAPDPYLLGAERLGVTQALVVEDSDAGEASGRAAGFDVVRVREQSGMVPLVRRALGLA